MMFVTESLSNCVKNLISENRRNSSLDSGELDELVIQRGLLQITEALIFLHQNAGFVHLNVEPGSILVDIKGDWKLFGLGFIEKLDVGGGGGGGGGSGDFYLPNFDPRLPSFTQINLDYSAPELILDHKLNPSNDVFALGCLILSIYNSTSPLSTNNNPNSYKSEITNNSIHRALRSKNIPTYLSNILPQLLTRNAIERISLESLKQSEFFDNQLVKTINFLDNFSAKLPSEKKVFLSGLYNILGQFPKSILQRKILQGLLDDLGTDSGLVYSILKIILIIGNDMSQLGFSEKILTVIKRVENEQGCQSAIIDFLDIFLSRLNGEEFKRYILPILMAMLQSKENANHDQQRDVLTKIKPIVEKLDFVTIKNDVYPNIAEIFGKTTSLAVKLQSLNAFHVLIEHELDKYVIIEKLIPLLSKMKTREPDIIMAALNVYSSFVNIVDIDVLITSVIPQVLSLSLETSLTIDQFGELMSRVRKMLDKVEQDRRKRLARNLPTEGVNGNNSIKITNLNDRNKSSPEQPLDFNSLISGTTKSSNNTNNNNTNNTNDTFSSLMNSNPINTRMTALNPTTARTTSLNTTIPTLTPKTSPISSYKPPSRSTAITLEPTRFTGTTTTSSTASNIDWSRATKPAFSTTKPIPPSIPPLLPKPSTTNWNTNSLQPQNKPPSSTAKPSAGLDQYQSLL